MLVPDEYEYRDALYIWRIHSSALCLLVVSYACQARPVSYVCISLVPVCLMLVPDEYEYAGALYIWQYDSLLAPYQRLNSTLIAP